MGSLNKCCFIGNLGRDPEVKFTTGGQPVANFSIACNEAWTDKSGEKQERVEWIRLVAFGKLAELVQRYVTKGKQIYVEGRMQTRQYEKDGEKRYATEVVASSVVFLGGGEKREASGGAPWAGDETGLDDRDIPFIVPLRFFDAPRIATAPKLTRR